LPKNYPCREQQIILNRHVYSYTSLHNFTLSITYFVPVHFLETLSKFGKGPSRTERAPTF